MASRTIENYLKQLYLEQEAAPQHFVAMGKLANAMGVAPGTATAMVKALSDASLVTYEPRGGVKLSPAGEQLALHVLRRHRLVELFIVQIVGYDWSEVHAEAEELEHVISDKLLDRMDRMLGHPAVDPHGDPIPFAKAAPPATPVVSLASCPLNAPLCVARVLDQDPQFLQFVRQAGLIPGAVITVTQRDTQADAVTLALEGKSPMTLSTAVATKFLVRAA